MKRRYGLAAIACLAIAYATIMHSLGWAETSNFALVRAFADGKPEIDRWHWETKDKSWYDGHFYSVKAPGLALVTAPAYRALTAVGGTEASADLSRNAREGGATRWEREGTSRGLYSDDPQRADRVRTRIEEETPMVWALGLIGVVLPALVLLLLVRSVVERIEPGYGTAAAVTLGLGTILMTFAAEYFSHVASAALGFAAFAILFREREGPPRLLLVAAAGLVAGLAVTFEYPLGLLGAILLVYALSRPSPRLPRALVYGATAVVGAIPALAFNWWALGSPLDFAYSSAVAVQGLSGHAVLGLNDPGFYGIGVPRPSAALDLLVASRGILTVTPVLAVALVGAALMRQTERRAEANVVLAVAAVFFIYNTGYWLPFGGGTPGPRLLIPAMPFLALGWAVSYRRLPALTLTMAIPSFLLMLVGSMTFPLIGQNGTSTWAGELGNGILEHTLLTVVGVGNGWLAAAPVVAAIATAIVLAARATPRARLSDARLAAGALAAWVLIFVFGPTIAGDPVTPLHHGTAALTLAAGAAVISAATLVVLRYRERRDERSAGRLAPEPTG